MDYKAIFMGMLPGFFDKPGIRNLPETAIATELVMDLHTEETLMIPVECPAHITFGEYHGDLAPLRAAVAEVEKAWVDYFTADNRVFCAFDGDRIIAFCIVDEMGTVQGLRIGGPGCVGTLPAYRKQGIGLEMVRRATLLMKELGVDLGWIHYTCLVSWYSKLGYRPVLRWNCKGFLDEQ